MMSHHDNPKPFVCIECGGAADFSLLCDACKPEYDDLVQAATQPQRFAVDMGWETPMYVETYPPGEGPVINIILDANGNRAGWKWADETQGDMS